MGSGITEIVTMNCIPGIGKAEFVGIVDGLERGFHMRQSGYIDTELLCDDKDDTWIMIQHWESEEQMKAASKQMFRDAATERYRASIDPKNIKIVACPTLKLWCSGSNIAYSEKYN